MKNHFRVFIYFSLFTFHFSLLHAQNDWLWGKYGKGTGNGNSVIIDNSGNFILTGFFGTSIIEFGPYTLINNKSNSDAFLVKYDQNGNLLWVKQSAGDNEGPSNGYISSTDKAGNIYMTANLADTVIFGTYLLHTSSINSVCSFLVKYDPNGNVLWAKQSSIPSGSTTGGIVSNFISTDRDGNSYITGFFIDTAIFGNDTLYFGGNNGNTFLVKYNSEGNVVWAKESRAPSSACGADVFGESLDRFGNIYLTGRFDDTVSFGSDTLICQYNNANFFLTKYDTNGNIRWARQTKLSTSSCFGSGYAATCDLQGNIYVTGEFSDTIAFGTHTLIASSSNYTNIFVVKYDSNGNVIWAIQSQTPSNYGASAWSISSDTVGHIYVCGGVGDKKPVFIIDKDTLKTTDTAVYDDPAFLLKFDTAGKLLCGNIFPYSSLYFSSIASDPTGDYVYYASTLGTEAIFGKDTIDPWAPKSEAFPIIARWKECNATLDVQELKIENGVLVKVYPNPNNGNFVLEYNLGEETGGRVRLYNPIGEMVGEYILNNSEGKMNVSNPGLSNGVYIWKLYTNTDLIKFGKVIIIK